SAIADTAFSGGRESTRVRARCRTLSMCNRLSKYSTPETPNTSAALLDSGLIGGALNKCAGSDRTRISSSAGLVGELVLSMIDPLVESPASAEIFVEPPLSVKEPQLLLIPLCCPIEWPARLEADEERGPAATIVLSPLVESIRHDEATMPAEG